MPFKSSAQRKFLFAKKPEVAKKFAADTVSGAEHAKKAMKRMIKK